MKFRFPGLPRSDAPAMPIAGSEPGAPAPVHDAGGIMIPYEQASFYKEAQKQTRKWEKKATWARWKLRGLTLLFIAIAVAIMLLDGFSNRSALIRHGKTADSDVAVARLKNHPQYIAEREARDSRIAAIDNEIAYCNGKLALYKARGEQGRMTAWRNRITELEREKAALNVHFNNITEKINLKSESETRVNTDNEFYSLLAFALPLMVFLCTLGVEKAEDGRRGIMLFAAYLIQTFNAYLTASAIAHGHPDPAIRVFGSQVAVIGMLAFGVILFGVPTAFTFCSRMLLRYISAWHDTLQYVFGKQRAFIALRNQIRDDEKDARIAVVRAEQEIQNAYLEGRKKVIEKSAETEQRKFEAAQEVAQTAAAAKVSALIPTGLSATECAEWILKMKATGEWRNLKREGIKIENIAAANGTTAGSIFTTLDRLKKEKAAGAAIVLANPPNNGAMEAPNNSN